VVEVDHEVPTGEHRLGDGDHEFARAEPAASLFQLAEVGVERRRDPECAIELTNEMQAGSRRQGRVGVTKRDRASARA
jgi:hypothetical protein